MYVILFSLAIQIYLVLKNRQKRYFRCRQIGKKNTYNIFEREILVINPNKTIYRWEKESLGIKESYKMIN